MRIAPPSTIHNSAPAPAPASPVRTSSSGSSFQATLEQQRSSSESTATGQQTSRQPDSGSSLTATEETSSAAPNQTGSRIASQTTVDSVPSPTKGNTTAGADEKTQAGASPSSRTASKNEKAQPDSASGNANTPAPVLVIPAGQEPAEDTPSGQGNEHRMGGSSSLQSATGDGHASTPQKQINPATPLDAAVDGDVQVAASTTPDATPQDGTGIPAQNVGETFTALMGLAAPSALPASGDGNQHPGKAAAKETSDATGSKNSDLTSSSTDTGTSKAAVNGSSDPSSPGAQNNGQSAQHSQADPSQAAIPSKGAESSTSQAQNIAMHMVSAENTTAHRTPDATAASPRPGDQREGAVSNQSDAGEAVAASGINAARLIQTISETEMRVGMHSTEFGDISIRTTVSQQQMLAQISLDHSDLSQAIAAHVSTVEAKLGNEYGLHALIQVNHQGAAFSGDSGHPSQREQKGFAGSAAVGSITSRAEPDSSLSPAALFAAGDGQRLDIRA